MSNVTSIGTHPRFSRKGNKELSPVLHDPILGLDGGMIDSEFMTEAVESVAVVRFLCDMGFVVHGETRERPVKVAVFENGPFTSDWISIEVPKSFNMLIVQSGMHAFRNKQLSRTQSVLLGKLGTAASLALLEWKGLYSKVA